MLTSLAITIHDKINSYRHIFIIPTSDFNHRFQIHSTHAIFIHYLIIRKNLSILMHNFIGDLGDDSVSVAHEEEASDAFAVLH